jgi:polyphosphate glucokinase
MNVLVVDVGGSNVKILATGHQEPRKFPSGPALTAEEMVAGIKDLAGDWNYDVVSIGYPGPVLHGRPVAEPHNLGPGWVGFDFQAAFGCPVKVINDAAMQAMGSYQGGKMLFLGLGTGLGSTLIVDGIVEPMELGHLPYRKGTYEDYVGIRGLERVGRKKWRRYVADVVSRFIAALEPGDVVLGGGNVRNLKELPAGCRAGDNADAFKGGFRLWEEASDRRASTGPVLILRKGTKRKECKYDGVRPVRFTRQRFEVSGGPPSEDRAVLHVASRAPRSASIIPNW